jgi:hypothetical protein
MFRCGVRDVGLAQLIAHTLYIATLINFRSCVNLYLEYYIYSMYFTAYLCIIPVCMYAFFPTMWWTVWFKMH